MSSEALAWAFKQECKSSSVKFTLVALCECANYRTGRITPSIEHICEITGQNRKTVINNIAELERQGVITDTGERVGRTKQIKVYQAAMGTVPKTERSQERNSTENAPKQSQKRDTEPSCEPSSPSEKKQTQKRAHVLSDHWQPCSFAPGSKSREVIDGWTADEFDRNLEHFTAHHRGKGSRFTDWQDAWSTWVLNSRKWNHGNGRQQLRSASPRSGREKDGVAAALDRRLGLDDAPGETGRRDAGPGAGYGQLKLAAPGSRY